MLQNCTTYRVLKNFFINPLKQFNLKEISVLSEIAHTSVKNELKKFVRIGIIKIIVESKGKRKFPLYAANIDYTLFKILKKISNEYQIRTCGLVEYLKINLMPNSIMLFGSFSRGEDTIESDIDLFIESSPKDINLRKFEKKLNRKINLIFKKDINNLKKELLNNIINGIILYGEIKLK